MNLYIITQSQLSYYGGGTDTWMSYFIPAIANQFKKITIMSVKTDDNEYNLLNFQQKNIEVLRLSEPKYIDLFLKYTKYLRNNIQKGDILLSIGTGFPGWVGATLKKELKDNIIHITWARGIPHKEITEHKGTMGSIIIKQIEKITLKNSDAIIFNGNDTFEYYTRKFKKFLPNNKIVIPNALKSEKFFENPNPDFSIPLKIGYYGRFVKARGFHYFIKLAEFKELRSLYEFNAWGWSENNLNLEKYNINYKGKYNSDNYKVYAESDLVLFLIPSKNTFGGGTSHNLLEALASGRVIIGWDNPILRNVLNESCAYLIEEGNLNEVKKTLLKIHKNKDELNEKSKNARLIAKKYSQENHVKTFLEFVNQIYLKHNSNKIF